MDVDVLAIAAVTITVVLFVLLSYLGRKKHSCRKSYAKKQ